MRQPDSSLDAEQKRQLQDAHRLLAAEVDQHLQGMFHSEGFPLSLCHYTDFAGLAGILASHSLWATYTKTLNDGTEDEHGASVVAKYLWKHLPNTQSKEQFFASLRVASSRSFAACFCESPSLLSMWRGYAGHGGGYCLEFDGPKLLACIFPPYSTRLPFKIAYSDVLPSVIKPVVDAIAQFSHGGGVSAIASATFAKLIASKIKHPAFIQEEEWRIVIRDPEVSTLKFRAGHADIKPYIALSPSTDGSQVLPLRRVLFGPTLRHDEVLIETIELMLERYGYSSVSVEPSGIPYRL